MDKKLFDVFPGLKLQGDLHDIGNQILVEKIARLSQKALIHIYIKSPVLIDKREILTLEEEIAGQLLKSYALKVRVTERFELPEIYTAKTLMDLYEDSFLYELSQDAPILHALYQKSDISYPEDNEIVLRVEASEVSRQEADRLVRRMNNMLRDRCSLQATVRAEYTEPKKEDTELSDREAYEHYLMKAAEAQAGEQAEASHHAESASSQKKGMAEQASIAGASTADKTTGRKASGRSGGKLGGKAGGKASYNAFRDRDEATGVLYGRVFKEIPIEISSIDESIFSDIVISGEICAIEDRPIKGERKIVTFAVYDGTDTINVKIFIENEYADSFEKSLKEARFVRVKGLPQYDTFDKEINISRVRGIMVAGSGRIERTDDASEKRCELHIHTKMSDTDGVSEVADIVNRAYKWGMPGVAITDHGVVQSLTAAGHAWESLYKKACGAAKEKGEAVPDRQDFFKVVLGMECYLVNDEKGIVVNSKDQSLANSDYVVFDLETTGFSPSKNRIIEFGAVRIEDGKIAERFSEFVNPGVPIPYKITKLTSITDAMVADAEPIEQVLPRFIEFAKGAVLVGHNVAFDISFINENCKRLGYPADYTTLDTLGLSRTFYPRQARHTLDAVAKTLKIELAHHHRAVDDAEATAGIFLSFLTMLQNRGIERMDGVNELGRMTPEAAKHLRPQHAILLARNTLGRVNLYRLVTLSHLEFFHRVPIVPRSVLEEHREGLLVGSADATSDLFEAVMDERSEEDIAGIVRFYDYLEVQPEECHTHMIDNERYEEINSVEDIRQINRRIADIGAKFNKPVVATGDVHFLDPEDKEFRSMLLSAKDFTDEVDMPLYLRTTTEMMKSFEYLGANKAHELVIDNPRKILDMCDSISPVRPDKCPPVIADSDVTLRKICYDKAHEIYGEPLPAVVEERLEKELSSIIGNGFAVMYIIAQKLVWKSIEDGYIVGSRGSVGSSFVAFAAGITEVNSLPPHYVCPSCKHSDFDSEEVRRYEAMSGCDMPDKDCSVCGTKMVKDGFNIPFETFLGFKGDKEPDIDLNFSGEYQANAHKYTEEIFGKGQTYRAGTVSAFQDKTAYGIVKKYLEKKGTVGRRPEINRLCNGLNGVRRGTGQHPGGIIVLPKGEDINSFTPVQHPANDMEKMITTHYDYHSIDHNLLKLDILGHDDPTMVRFLYDATGIDPTKVPLDDKEVMQLFKDTSSLKVTSEQLQGVKLGCLGLPEFGTDNAMQMVLEAKPTSFTDLIRISGLSHGTDVWHGNARELILGGTCTIDTAICNRDDIMNFLIQKGMDKSLSFKTMENVRKGKGLTPEMKEAMQAVDVPQWYIDACLKIKYMFPKAHATAYVMNAWRLAWFKVHEPLAFYAAWFSIRAKAMSYFDMCRGKAHMLEVMSEYKSHETLSNVEQNALTDMRLVLEMYERGYEFMPIDIFKAHATKFLIIDGKIMPPFVAIDGMGPIAAEGIFEAVKDGPFLSRDDFKTRTKCPQAALDKMAEDGMLGDLPETNQMSLFDFMKPQ